MGASKNVANLVGFSARIATRAARLPCEPHATFLAFSTTWVGVVKNTGTRKWAQMGYTYDRVSGVAAVTFQRYTEVMAGPTRATDYRITFFPGPAPAASGAHVYKGEVVQPAVSSSSSSSSGAAATGTWNFYYDGVLLDSWSHVGWANDVADRVDYNTEVLDAKSQVPGTNANRCLFDQCQYKVRGGNFVNAGLVDGNLRSTNPTEHTFNYINGTSFEIWDL